MSRRKLTPEEREERALLARESRRTPYADGMLESLSYHTDDAYGAIGTCILHYPYSSHNRLAEKDARDYGNY